MSSATLLLAAVALVVTGLGLLLLASAQVRARREQSQAFLRAQTEQVRLRYAQARDPALQVPARDLRRHWDDFLRRADLAPTRRTAILWGAPVALFTAIGALAGQWLGAAAACIVALAIVACLLWNRVRRLHKKLLSQLPGFLDGVVRLMTIGSSVPAAFQNSIANTEAPLRQCLVQAVHLQRAGKELDQAVLQVGRTYKVDELVLVASVLRLSVRYGGRADVVMERTAAFMRDREAAQRELLALSAETRLSAWILGLLPLVVAGGLFMLNAGYIMLMWKDPAGKTMLLTALGLEAAGALMLYRLAKSI
ncbi:type II secretion system F family protein [Cupriavidus sp. NPDC089707]|uniref:type II secretion system F family protein n=1 Tax=Cupriavidus sp. NPDC089707 TaxID=3363963 RepID=UPI0037FE44D6